MNSLQEICEYLKQHDRFLVLMHASPDGDTIGSGTALCAALQQLGKKARFACGDPIDKKYNYMLDAVQEQDFEPEHIVSVDVADTKLLGDLESVYGDKIDVSIDHHGSNRLFGKYNYVNSQAAANCENIYHLLVFMGIDITPAIAACLYTGIATDTGCFRYTNTNADTLRIAACLLDAGAPNGVINQVMFETKSRARIEMEQQAIEAIEYHENDQIALMVITRAMMQDIQPADLEGVTALPRQIEGVKIGITIKEKADGTLKASVRTLEPINASAICAHFGGGGHAAAAGCSLPNDLEQAKKELLAVCKQELER